MKAETFLAIIEAAKKPQGFGNTPVLKVFVHEWHPGINIVLDGPAFFDDDLEKFKKEVSTILAAEKIAVPSYQIGLEKNKIWVYVSFAGEEIDGEIERGNGLSEEISHKAPLTMENAKNLLYNFWQRSSDACPLEATAAEEEQEAFGEWVQENYAY